MSDESPKQNKLVISLDWRLVSFVLFVALLVSVFLWKPWTASNAKISRKITVSGQATIKAEPDEYVLMPYFKFSSTDIKKNTTDLTATAKQTTDKLKELGVKDEQIKSNTSSYDSYYQPLPAGTNADTTTTLSYTITLNSKDVSQKVQDYFLTTSAQGQLSPVASFSEGKRKELESKAKTAAIDDAKSKATANATQIGAKLGKVITISDSASVMPMEYMANVDSVKSSGASQGVATSSVPVQSGQNDFSSSVSVEYEIK